MDVHQILRLKVSSKGQEEKEELRRVSFNVVVTFSPVQSHGLSSPLVHALHPRSAVFCPDL